MADHAHDASDAAAERSSSSGAAEDCDPCEHDGHEECTGGSCCGSAGGTDRRGCNRSSCDVHSSSGGKSSEGFDREGRPMMRIDVHTHILPRDWPSLKAKYGYGGFVQLEHHCAGKARMVKDDGTFFREIEESCWSPPVREKEMSAAGIGVHVLSTVPVMFSYWAEPEDCLDLSQMLNDSVAAQVATNPRRFVGLGTIPMCSPELAVDELKRCVNVLGLSGVQIGTHVNDCTLDDPRLFPIFKTAADLGAAIFVHPWDMIGQKLMAKYWLPWLVGMPAETTMAICSLMLGGIFDRLPHLRVCFAHGGGSFAATLGRIQHGFDVRPDLVAVDSKIPPTQQMGKFWADSLVHDPVALDLIMNTFGENRVCLGSDYPFPLGEYTKESMGQEYCCGQLVDSMSHWSAAKKQKVFSDNALEWLDMNQDRFWK